MSVTSYHITQYVVECDGCGISDVVADNLSEGVYSKQQAIKWAGMHKTKDGKILCNKCFKEYKKELRNNGCCS